MLHKEMLKKVSGTIEMRHNGCGIGVYVFINRNQTAAIYESMEDLISHVYFGEDVEHFKCNEDELFSIYESDKYDYKQIIEQLKSK